MSEHRATIEWALEGEFKYETYSRQHTLRFDGGISPGQAITPAFDSMLAKLVAFGATRAAAASTLQQGLHELVLLGVPTNIDYLARVLRHPQFLAGQLHTAFLVQYAQDLLPPEAPEQAAAATLAALLADADFRHAAFDVPEPHATIGAWRN